MAANLEDKGLYRVNEIYPFTIQGEGLQAGIPMSFIRLQGCPVGCEWCDTKYTWYHGGKVMHVSEIVDQLGPTNWVCVTGGEPCIWDLDSLFLELRSFGKKIHLETSGTFDMKGIYWPNWLTCSPKHRVNYAVKPDILAASNEYKIVVDEHFRDDLTFLWEYLLPPIVLMPEGCPPRPEMVAKTLEILKQHPTWHYSDRLQYRIGVQ